MTTDHDSRPRLTADDGAVIGVGEKVGSDDNRSRQFEVPESRPTVIPHVTPGWSHLTSASAPLLVAPHRALMMASLVIVLLVGSLIAWASFAELEEHTSGQGRVIPASKIQVVQNLEGGIVKQILTRVGARVKKGQTIFQIDATGFGSNLEERLERLAGLRARTARLTSEVEGTEIGFPKELRRSHPGLVKQEADLFATRKRELNASVEVLTQQVAQKRKELEEAESTLRFTRQILKKVQEEIAFTKPLLKSRLTSKVDFIKLETKELELKRDIANAELKKTRAQQAIEEARQRLLERENRFRAESLTELNKVQVEMAALKQEIRVHRDRVARTDVRAPVAGIVKDVKVTTVGQVVKSGVDLAEIVPIRDSLLVEANVRPRDIAFLRPGQKAKVKISAYDYTVYGELDATLENISADTITDDKGNAFYRIRVRTKKAYLTHGKKKLPIMPGMVAQVDVLTGKKTVMNYLLKPFRKMSSEAMRER
jgi:adhesin transport system membrane fusion protein